MNNPFFLIGAGILMVGIALILFGNPPPPADLFSLMTSDGRCTGFPNGIGQWQWGDCCQAHDMAGISGVPNPQADAALITCLVDRMPAWASPLCFLGVALMGFGRPTYNLLKRVTFGWIK